MEHDLEFDELQNLATMAHDLNLEIYALKCVIFSKDTLDILAENRVGGYARAIKSDFKLKRRECFLIIRDTLFDLKQQTRNSQ